MTNNKCGCGTFINIEEEEICNKCENIADYWMGWLTSFKLPLTKLDDKEIANHIKEYIKETHLEIYEKFSYEGDNGVVQYLDDDDDDDDD